MNRLLVTRIIHHLDLAAAEPYPQLQCLQYRSDISKVLVSLRLCGVACHRPQLLLLARATTLNSVIRNMVIYFTSEPQVSDMNCQMMLGFLYKLQCETQLAYLSSESVTIGKFRAGCYHRALCDLDNKRFSKLEGRIVARARELRKVRLSAFSKIEKYKERPELVDKLVKYFEGFPEGMVTEYIASKRLLLDSFQVGVYWADQEAY